jgi:kynurenine formamidase
MFQREFASNYTALDSTAAAHITSSSNIRLVGIDYLSIGMLEDIGETHRTLFRGVSHLQSLCRCLDDDITATRGVHVLAGCLKAQLVETNCCSRAHPHITSSSNIRLVGIDYLSIGMLEAIRVTHRTLFKGASHNSCYLNFVYDFDYGSDYE